MLILGYIVSKMKDSSIKEDIVKVVTSEEECTINVPKLIVGLDCAKRYAKMHNIDFDILNHHFSDGNMWTFKKTEKRDLYEHDIEDFKKNIKQSLINNINYYYINILNLKYNNIKRVYNLIINNSYNRRVNYLIIDKGMLYYPIQNNNVIGISLAVLEYIGIDRDKVIHKIKSNSSNKIYYTSYKNMWELKNEFQTIEYAIVSIFENNAIK